MKKLVSLLTVVAMLSNAAYAAPGFTNNTETTAEHTQLIAKTFNQFRYQMTVQGDASDANFQAQAIENFKQRMQEIQAQGVTPAEVMSYMRGSLLDASTRADFDRMMSSINTEEVSSEEAGNLAMQFMAGKYQQGASYAGGGKANFTAVFIIIGVVIVGVVTYFAIKYIKDSKAKTVTKTETATKTDTATETETKTDTETETETETKTDTATETKTDTKTETKTDTKTESHTSTVTKTDTKTDTKTETKTDTKTDTKTVTNTKTDTKTETKTETKTDTKTKTETKTKTDTKTDTGGNGNCSHGKPKGGCNYNGCSNNGGGNNGYCSHGKPKNKCNKH